MTLCKTECTEDSTYPKGTFSSSTFGKALIITTLCMLFTHDPANCHDPEVFGSERILGETLEHDPRDLVFESDWKYARSF